jgi:Protein of unknown function (DUF3035)
MRMNSLGFAVSAAAMLLAGCTSNGLAHRDRPDEFAVARTAPLVIPPDFALVPPRPGEPMPISADARTQALDALFGGPAPRSNAENQVLGAADADDADPAARSVVGDPGTKTVDKGATTQTIIAAPAGNGQQASASTPQ